MHRNIFEIYKFSLPPGLQLLRDFVSAEEEKLLAGVFVAVVVVYHVTIIASGHWLLKKFGNKLRSTPARSFFFFLTMHKH